MTEERIKELYTEEMSGSAPDMDAIWAKIDSRLTEKEAPAPKKKSNITLWRTGALIAACVTILIAVPSVLNRDDIASTEKSAPNNASNSISVEQALTTPSFFNDAADAENEAAEEVVEEAIPENTFETSDGPLNYNELSFAPSYTKNISCYGTPSGGDYFVEDDILVETECIIDAVVDNVYASPDGECVYYELTPKAVYGSNDLNSKITVASCSEYSLKIGGEYVIPLKTSDDTYQTVFDGVPQIEVTADGGLVYYNGWECLNAPDSQSIIYPQNKVDDFFYDRMMFTFNGDISPLIEKWSRLRSD